MRIVFWSVALLIVRLPGPAFAQWTVVSDTLSDQIRAIDFYGAELGIAVGHGTAYVSQDEGRSWTSANSETVSGIFFEGLEIDSTLIGPVAIAVGSTLSIVRSADGGETWRAVFSGADVRLHGACYVGDGRFMAFGEGGWVAESMDTGLSWQARLIYPSADMYGSTCFSGAIWVAGFASDGGLGPCCGVLMRSDDQGHTWHKKAELKGTTTGKFYAVRFASDLVGYAISTTAFINEHSQLWKTIDGGESWEEIGLFEVINAIDFADEDVGVMVGLEGLILWTEDGGETWVQHPSPVPMNFYAVDMLDAQTAVAGGDAYIIRNETGATVANEPNRVPQLRLKHRAYPNPANESVTISVETPTPIEARVRIIDTLGRVIVAVVGGQKAGSMQTFRMSLGSLPSGLYLYSVEAGKATANGTLLVAH